MASDGHPYLSGNFAPVHEEITAFHLPVTGRIPAHLHGRYLRNGPNPLHPDPANYHWFLGEGMVHGIRLRDGKAEWYRNRWVRNQQVAAALGEPWPAGPVHAGLDLAANTSVIGLAGRTFALMEAGALPYELTDELDTLGPSDFNGTLVNGYTAHPRRDPDTGELHAIVYFGTWDHVQYVITSPRGVVTRVHRVGIHGWPMMHDFSLTARHVVLYDTSVTYQLDLAARGVFPYAWDPGHGARVGVMSRERGPAGVRWFEIEPCLVFHPMNAYDDGDRIVAHVMRHERGLERGDRALVTEAVLERWTLDLGAGTVTQQRIDERAQEWPRFDERRQGKPNRYGYAAVAPRPSRMAREVGGLIKHDFERGTSELHWFAPGAGAAEGVFVPRAPDAAEDDGYVMAIVYSPARDRSELVILAAQDFGGEPLARVHLPRRVPAGIHGCWVPDGA